MTTSPTNHSRQGFTLIELLASIAVLAILVTIIFGVFNQASKAWVLGEARTETFQGARLALDLISRELETATATNASPTGAAGKQITLLAFENWFPPSSDLSSGIDPSPPNDAIFFVSRSPDSRESDAADLMESGYFVVYCKADVHTMKQGFYYLLRKQTKSTAPRGWDFLSSPVDWWQTPGTGAGSTPPIVSNILCPPLLDNVLRFEVRYEYADPAASNGTNIAEAWDTTSSGRPPSSLVSDPPTQLPRAFHIRLSVLDRRYAARASAIWGATGLSSAELTKLPYDYSTLTNPALQNIMREGLRTFFRTVYPRSAS